MRFLNIVLILLLSLWLFTSYGQRAYQQEDMANIKGVVLDYQSGEGLGATIVYELEPYGEDIGFCQSNAETGTFQLAVLKGRPYKLVISANDYIPLTVQIEIREDLERDIRLSPVQREIFTLQNLIFQRAQSTILEASHEDLNRLVSMMKERREMKIQLEGHTDFAGNGEANMALSQDRVEAVKAYLIKKGIKKNRIRLKAFGGSQPLTRQRTDEAKASNRRVEVRVLNADS